MGLVSKQVEETVNAVRRAVVPAHFTDTKTQVIVDVVVLVIYLALVLLLGKYLWNNVLCKAVTVVKPLPNVWHFLGLVVLLMLL